MTAISHGMDQISQDRYSVSIFRRTLSISSQGVLLVVMAVSIALRLMSAVYQGNTVTDLPGVYDQISYDGLARRVMDGHGFSFAEGHWPATPAGQPTAHWSFLYTIYLAALYKAWGHYPVIARVIQAIVTGIFQTLFTWRIGRRLFGGTVGLIAASVSAVYIYFFYYAGGLLTEAFYIVCILWIFDTTLRLLDLARQNRHQRLWRNWLELGLATGCAVLLRQLFLLFLPFLFFWIWWNFDEASTSDQVRKGPWKYRVRWSALQGLVIVVLVLVLMIAPWTIRNYRVFNTFVLLNTNAGFAFYWGNHPIQGTHFMPLLPVSYQSLIPTNLLSLNEGNLDKALLGAGIEIVLHDPVRYALLSASRIEEFVKFWPSRDSGQLSNVSRVGSFGIFLPFMLYGLWLSFSRFHRPDYPDQRSHLVLIYLFIAVYTAIHLLTWTLIRYRIPIDALLVVFAALAIEALIKTVLERQAHG